MIKPLFQNVIIVINGSEASIHAAQYGILMAKLYRCNLKAVYVVDTATIKQLTLGKFFVQDEGRMYEDNLRSDGNRYLEYIANLGKAKGVRIETELRTGAVWSEVIMAADEMKANLILLGGYKSDMNSAPIEKHDAVSSSNFAIITNAHCSVLVVREKMIEQLYKLA
ncbi:universal stress protein [Treponema brennaborense]|uniref:UspA domain-containing protein n=1 Tax=Treponema brennaborense (strain DSM 12168 / CIP 105900 / DD5/3) TaxID=906968 RepID=F4LQ39_TREBD|nr:universal stress protein [Treponema brennaborense]AEE17117.1 UspA domain-containing protein [Treponema brennaborense DSM 12168]